MDNTEINQILLTGSKLRSEVLEPMKQIFIGKDEVIDLLGTCLVGGENLFILGPPGTAKSALVQYLGQRLKGNIFVYLLTRFTEPNELFGPFDISKLRDGELKTNTEGMLSEASFVFLDELLNANSAILNSLLTSLNEKCLRRGKEIIPIQSLMFVGASNHLPEEDALNALFDRFLMRVHCDNVPSENLIQVLESGWILDSNSPESSSLHFDEIKQLQSFLKSVNLTPIRNEYSELIKKIRHAGISISDRRAVRLQRLIAASALLCGRSEAHLSDLWILRYIWESRDQEEILSSLVQNIISQDESTCEKHPGSTNNAQPNAEALAKDLEWMHQQLQTPEWKNNASYLKDRLSLLDGRCQWIEDQQQREHLLSHIEELWKFFNEEEAVA